LTRNYYKAEENVFMNVSHSSVVQSLPAVNSVLRYLSFQGLIAVGGFERMWRISDAGGRIVFFKYVCWC